MTKTTEDNRRKSLRRPILDTFFISVVIPKHGLYKLHVFDMSENGIGCEIDATEIEELSTVFPTKEGEIIDLRFYINQSLFIPLVVKLIRIQKINSTHRIGFEIQDKESKNYQALSSFVKLIDSMANIIQFDDSTQN